MSCKKQKTVSKLDLSNLDTTANPAVDFYQYACGGWMKKFPLPAEYARYGSFDKLAEDNQMQVKTLIEDLASSKQKAGSIGAKIGMLYTLGMDSAKLDQQKVEPIKAELEAIAALKSPDDFVTRIALMHKQGTAPFFMLYVGADQKNSKMNMLNLLQGGLGMPDRDYYLANDPESRETKAKYQGHIVSMFELAGYSTEASLKSAIAVVNLETSLAKASTSREDLRDPEKNYNKLSIADLQKLSPDFNWTLYLNTIGAPQAREINVGQTAFLKEALAELKKASPEAIKAYLAWNIINDAAAYLSGDFEKQNFEFYGKVLTGKEVMQPRWKRVVSVVNESVGEAVGQMYVEKYFPPEAKEKMMLLVENLRESLGERIQGLSWMSDTTKVKALEKLKAIKVKIGYPEKWRAYDQLNINEDSYWANIARARSFEFDFQIQKVGKPVDPAEWLMTPQTVNAYYEPTANEICFPAAILQPPFFDFEADDALNYGAIGVVIGHEMTHGFDDQGRMYDLEGNLKDWWVPQDAERFNAKTAVLVNHYNGIKVLDTLHANGVFTLGENIADQGGLQVSFNALTKALEKNPQKENIDGFTPQQRFFLAYANVWAQNIRDKEILRRTKVDPHSLGKWRVNGALPHVEAFVTAFNIKEGDGMWLSPELRASIW